jgi:hypothetical protein
MEYVGSNWFEFRNGVGSGMQNGFGSAQSSEMMAWAKQGVKQVSLGAGFAVGGALGVAKKAALVAVAVVAAKPLLAIAAVALVGAGVAVLVSGAARRRK